MKKLLFFALPLLLISGIVFTACKSNNDLAALRDSELSLLADFVSRYETVHKVDLKPTSSGLYYIEIAKGAGDTIAIGDKVQLWYNTYMLKDTTLIDSNMDNGKFTPLEFVVTSASSSSVIEGLNEAVKYMRPGGKAFLITPSEVAYGQNGSLNVPAFSTLLFDIEIYKVFRASEVY
jgi:FKBP-type peptidyl-prolyl cis-trans isomerase FkpA